MSARRAIDALQLELSVAVRMPGAMRDRALEAIGAVFANDALEPHDRTPIPVVRTIRPKAPFAQHDQRPAAPSRVGVEFYDASAGVGAMASFDLGPAAMGARIMMLLDRRRVALFTGEGLARREGARIALGPLALHARDGQVALRFSGPAVIVPDGAAYLSIERALASGTLDQCADIDVRLEMHGPALDLHEILTGGVPASTPADWIAAFGRLSGTIAIGGETRKLDAVGRVGLSFTGIGPARFVSRRMIWACFPTASPKIALEARVVSGEDGTMHRAARILGDQGWNRCDVTRLELEAPAIDAPPEKIAATVAIKTDAKIDGAPDASLSGEIQSFVPLSRPGPNQSRIYTSLGFARFTLGSHEGAGMFEYSRRIVAAASIQAQPSDDGNG